MLLPQNRKKHNLSHEVILSLTSHRPRFATLHLTLECLLRQSVSPYRLILWIDAPDVDFLPQNVKKLEAHGLEIRVTPENHGPYNKFVYTMRDAPKAIVVTTDDDTYYQSDFLEILLKNWSGNLKEIVCAMAFQVPVDAQGNKMKFLHWQPVKKAAYPLYDAVPFGVGGILYPPGSLFPEVLDSAKYKEACPRADDIWLFWMARLNGAAYRKVSGIDWPVEWPSSQKVALKYDNNAFKNDQQVARMVEIYGWPSFDRP